MPVERYKMCRFPTEFVVTQQIIWVPAKLVESYHNLLISEEVKVKKTLIKMSSAKLIWVKIKLVQGNQVIQILSKSVDF